MPASGGYRNRQRGAVVVDLPDGYWIKIRHMTAKESEEMSTIAAEGERAFHALALVTLDWNLDDEDGTKLPVESAIDVYHEMPASDFLILSEAFAANEGSPGEFEALERARKAARVSFRAESGLVGDDGRGGAASPPGVRAEEGPVESTRAQA